MKVNKERKRLTFVHQIRPVVYISDSSEWYLGNTFTLQQFVFKNKKLYFGVKKLNIVLHAYSYLTSVLTRHSYQKIKVFTLRGLEFQAFLGSKITIQKETICLNKVCTEKSAN